MTLKLYTIKTCDACLKYEITLGKLCSSLDIRFETYDIDSDPILSVEYLREYRHCAQAIPFFGIYDADSNRINCFSGIIEDYKLELLLIKYGT